MSETEKPVVDIKSDESQEQPAQTEAPKLSEEETQALAEGWKPKEKWLEDGGSEDDWRPAKVFNEVGRLKKSLAEKDKETKKLNKTVALMKEHHLKVRETAINEAITALRKERSAALKAEEFSKAEEIRDRIDDIRNSAAKGTGLPPEIEQQIQEVTTQSPPPQFYEFLERNPWYKPGGRDEMTKKADALGEAYHTQNPDWGYEDVLSAVEKDIKKLYPDKFEKPTSPVNDGGSRGSPSSTKKKVSLSANELEVARSFGMTPEEYAKELESYKGR